MMGAKIRNFAPLPADLSLEELVPKDNFYRLEATLDLSFVRDLVRDCYASSGRPSVDPEVFFRLQLVMFFDDIRSERQLVQAAADRLSIRWYLGVSVVFAVHERPSPLAPSSFFGWMVRLRNSSHRISPYARSGASCAPSRRALAALPGTGTSTTLRHRPVAFR